MATDCYHLRSGDFFSRDFRPSSPADYKQNVSCDCSRYNFTGSIYNLNVDKLNPGNSNFSRTRFPFSILLLQFNHRQLILFDKDSHSCVVPCRFELSCDDKCTDGRPRKRNLKPRQSAISPKFAINMIPKLN